MQNERLRLVQKEWQPGDRRDLCQRADSCSDRRSAGENTQLCHRFWGTASREKWDRSKGAWVLLSPDVRGLPICFAAVSDPEYHHDFLAFINLVDDSIISDPNSSIILRAGELATPCRPRVLGQSTEVRDDTMEGLHWEPPQIPLRCPFEVDLIHSGDTPPGNPPVS